MGAGDHPALDHRPDHLLPVRSGAGVIPASPPLGAQVRIEGLTKRYPGNPGVLALDRVDLSVPAGAIVGLLGPNGAGKTTAIRLLVGLARATAGSVSIDGRSVDEARHERPGGIGVLDQDPRYYAWMRGRELVELAARLTGLAAREARSRSAQVLDEVGLADALDRRIRGYSGGMLQRLGLAQALVGRPRLLVLDEPVSSLDPEGRRDVLALIERLRGTTTVLFSTHVLTDIERICDRVAVLRAGQLLADAELPELLARYAVPVFRIVPEPGQEAPARRLAEALPGSGWVDHVDFSDQHLNVHVNDESAASLELLAIVVAHGVRVASFERSRPDLEEVFLRLVNTPEEPVA